MRRFPVLLLAASAVALSGCATKGFVRESVADLETRQNARMDEIDATSREALERAIAAGKLAEGKLLYSVVLSDDAVKFPVDGSALSAEAEARLTTLLNQLKTQNKPVYIEIQGHTDSTGSDAYNQKLGMERAEAARLFLYKQGLPLSRIATISYGETAPVASNATPQGRAANRRVVLVVLN